MAVFDHAETSSMLGSLEKLNDARRAEWARDDKKLNQYRDAIQQKTKYPAELRTLLEYLILAQVLEASKYLRVHIKTAKSKALGHMLSHVAAEREHYGYIIALCDALTADLENPTFNPEF